MISTFYFVMVSKLKFLFEYGDQKSKVLKLRGCAAGFMRLEGFRDHCEEGVHLDWSVESRNLRS